MTAVATILIVLLGVAVLFLKAVGALCPRCGHWDHSYPMCLHPWHLEKEHDPDAEARRPDPTGRDRGGG